MRQTPLLQTRSFWHSLVRVHGSPARLSDALPPVQLLCAPSENRPHVAITTTANAWMRRDIETEYGTHPLILPETAHIDFINSNIDFIKYTMIYHLA